MIVLTMLGLDKMMTLAKANNHDFDMTGGILEDIDFESNLKFLLDSLVGSASKRN